MRSVLRALSRGILLLLHLALGLMLSVPLQLWCWLRPLNAETLRNQVVMGWFRGLAKILQVRIKSSGEPAAAPLLRVSNHISWLDIVVLAGQMPGSFVAKQEVRAWPLIGFLCDTADTVFIRRGDRDSTAETIARISEVLSRGRSVFVFPEGTSSDGRAVKPFKRRLYRAALDSGAGVQAVSLRYLEHGAPHPRVPYTGDDHFLHNVWRVLNEAQIEVHLEYCPPLAGARQLEAVRDERELARITYEQVRRLVEDQMEPEPSHAG